MIDYIVYDKFTGKITRTGYCPDNDFQLQAIYNNEAVLEGQTNDILFYVVNSIVMPKPENPSIIDKLLMLADGLDLTTISLLPNPSTVTLDGTSYEVTDGILEFTLDVPGTYKIKIDSFPFKDLTFEVIAS